MKLLKNSACSTFEFNWSTSTFKNKFGRLNVPFGGCRIQKFVSFKGPQNLPFNFVRYRIKNLIKNKWMWKSKGSIE